MAGYDLEVDAPRFVSLQIEMHVCAKPDYFRSDVKAALLEIFSNQILPDGRRGVFHPDNFTFGQTVWLSPLIAKAQAVDGVQSVQITVFQREGQDDPKPLQDGFLPMGRLEIARCDNDRNFAERGVFRTDRGRREMNGQARPLRLLRRFDRANAGARSEPTRTFGDCVPHRHAQPVQAKHACGAVGYHAAGPARFEDPRR